MIKLPFRASAMAAVILAISSLGLTACGGGGSAAGPSDNSGSAAVTALTMTDTAVGTGSTAIATKTVTVHYTGWLYNVSATGNKGTKFDSSVDRGTPFQFKLGAGQVIQGWDQGVVGMKVGGKRTLIIPSSMAYGSAGTGNGVIPANAALVFDVELLAVQ